MRGEVVVVPKAAWESAKLIIEVAAKGWWGGDNDWKSVLMRDAKEWLDRWTK